MILGAGLIVGSATVVVVTSAVAAVAEKDWVVVAATMEARGGLEARMGWEVHPQR